MGAKGSVLAPSLGVRANLGGSGKVVSYIGAAASLLRPSASVALRVVDGHVSSTEAAAIEDDTNDSIKETLSKLTTLAWRVGFGAESPLTDSLYLSTELGMRGLYSSAKDIQDIGGLSDADLEARLLSMLAGTYASIGISVRF